MNSTFCHKHPKIVSFFNKEYAQLVLPEVIVELCVTGSLHEAVFLEYARILVNLEQLQAAEFYCRQAGTNGEQLLKEIEILTK